MESTSVHIIKDSVDYVAEAIALLCHMGRGKNYQQIRLDMEKEYVIKFQKELHKFALLEEIEKRAGIVLKKNEEDLQYYFGVTDEEKTDCVGRLILLWDEWCGYTFSNIQSYKEYLDELSEQDYCEKFGYALQCYGDAVRDENPYEAYHTPIDIIEYIMKMDAPQSDKWKIQTVFLAKKEHQIKVLTLVEMAIDILKEFSTELEGIGKEFQRYWTKKLGEHPFRHYVSEKLSIHLDENPLGYVLQPSFISIDLLGVHTEATEEGIYKEPDRGLLGIILGDEFEKRTNIENNDTAFDNYALTVLKLLSDKSKFEILSYVKGKQAYGSELAKYLNLTTATISHHMTGLVTAGLVKMKKEENKVYYLANKKALSEVLDYCRKVLVDEM